MIPICLWDLPLPRQNLPKPYIGLKNTQGVGAYETVGDAVNRLGHAEEAGNRIVIQGPKLCKNKVLVAQPSEVLGQDADRLGSQALLRRTSAVDFT